MLTTLIIFIVSSITAVFIIVNKQGQINGSRWYVQLHSHEFERKVLNRGGIMWQSVADRSRSVFAVMLEKVEKFFMRSFFKIFRYIGKLSDMVKGKDVPKNKGSASFFLKRIDEVKKV